MVVLEPPRVPRSVGEALGTGRLLDALIKILASHFLMVCEDVRGVSTYKCTGRGLHSFLAHLELVVDPVSGLDQLALLGLTQTERCTFFTLCYPYGSTSTKQPGIHFSCWVDLTNKGLPTVVELLAELFVVRRIVRAVTQADHVSHLGLVSLPDCPPSPRSSNGGSRDTLPPLPPLRMRGGGI